MQIEFVEQFQLQLKNLVQEIDAYPDEQSLWVLKGDIKNPAGTLAYHICGNLSEYIGNVMGNTGYARNRPLEFSIRDVPKAQLIKWIGETAEMIAGVVPSLDLDKPFPKEVWGIEMSQGAALLRLLWHLGWHMGQINYHRRLTLAIFS